MAQYKAVLRYFPLGPVAGPRKPITKAGLTDLLNSGSVNFTVDEIKGKNAVMERGGLKEETMNCPIEEISQTVVTIETDDEQQMRLALKKVFHNYRAPRTVFGFTGSNELAKVLIDEVCNEDDGWC